MAANIPSSKLTSERLLEIVLPDQEFIYEVKLSFDKIKGDFTKFDHVGFEFDNNTVIKTVLNR